MFAFKFEIIFWQPISVWREAIRFNKCEHLDPNRFRYGDRNCRPVINKLHRLTYIRGIQMSSKLCYVVLIRVIYTVFLVEARLQLYICCRLSKCQGMRMILFCGGNWNEILCFQLIIFAKIENRFYGCTVPGAPFI